MNNALTNLGTVTFSIRIISLPEHNQQKIAVPQLIRVLLRPWVENLFEVNIFSRPLPRLPRNWALSCEIFVCGVPWHLASQSAIVFISKESKISRFYSSVISNVLPKSVSEQWFFQKLATRSFYEPAVNTRITKSQIIVLVHLVMEKYKIIISLRSIWGHKGTVSCQTNIARIANAVLVTIWL